MANAIRRLLACFAQDRSRCLKRATSFSRILTGTTGPALLFLSTGAACCKSDVEVERSLEEMKRAGMCLKRTAVFAAVAIWPGAVLMLWPAAVSRAQAAVQTA